MMDLSSGGRFQGEGQAVGLTLTTQGGLNYLVLLFEVTLVFGKLILVQDLLNMVEFHSSKSIRQQARDDKDNV